MQMMAPIPGMSLTQEPGNTPWEQPPLYASPEEALDFYMEKLEDEDTLDDLLFALEAGYPVASMVDFLTSHSVMEGYHTVDVKMLVSPLLHEYLVNLAEATDTPYKEEMGPSKEDRMKERDKKRTQVLLIKALEEGLPEFESEDVMEEVEDDMEEQESTPLISRRTM